VFSKQNNGSKYTKWFGNEWLRCVQGASIASTQNPLNVQSTSLGLRPSRRDSCAGPSIPRQVRPRLTSRVVGLLSLGAKQPLGWASIPEWAFRTRRNNPGRWSFRRISVSRGRWPLSCFRRTPRGAMEQITGTKRNATQAGLPTATSLAPSRGAGDHGDSTHAGSGAMEEDNAGPAEVDPQRRDLLRQLEDIGRERLALQQGVLFGYSRTLVLRRWPIRRATPWLARSGLNEIVRLVLRCTNLQRNRRLPWPSHPALRLQARTRCTSRNAACLRAAAPMSWPAPSLRGASPSATLPSSGSTRWTQRRRLWR
jgi:hypothetical protein